MAPRLALGLLLFSILEVTLFHEATSQAIRNSGCFQGANTFYILDNILAHSASDAFCSANLPGSRLASVVSSAENLFVQNLISAIGLTGQAYNIGLSDPTGSSTSQNGVTSRFKWIDGSTDVSFFATPFVTPWASAQPDDASGNQDCVQLAGTTWSDIACTTQNRIICKLNAICGPTNAPTKKPTFAPTKSPTKKPTLAPTKSPTKKPTLAPTKSPTKKPTFAPTRSPTKKPTFAPTKSPIIKATVAPTKSPTKTPTLAPTKSPTSKPTFSPTRFPTAAPIPGFSLAPTLPTQAPETLAPTTASSNTTSEQVEISAAAKWIIPVFAPLTFVIVILLVLYLNAYTRERKTLYRLKAEALMMDRKVSALESMAKSTMIPALVEYPYNSTKFNSRKKIMYNQSTVGTGMGYGSSVSSTLPSPFVQMDDHESIDDVSF